MGAIYRFNLTDLAEKFNIDYFVETGTLYGDGVKYAMESTNNAFKEIHSIELLDDLHEDASSKFSSFTNIHIHHGRSVDLLEGVIKNLDGNILFWLDAHYPGADIGRNSYYQPEKEEKEVLPLESELAIIKKVRENYDDVIICDDLWLYEDGVYGSDAGTLDNHLKIHCGGETKEQIGKPNANFFDEFWASTHDIIKLKDDQGYAILIPKP